MKYEKIPGKFIREWDRPTPTTEVGEEILMSEKMVEREPREVCDVAGNSGEGP